MKVRPTDPAPEWFDEHLARARPNRSRDILDPDVSLAVKDDCLHR
jgi:hypothetical protein